MTFLVSTLSAIWPKSTLIVRPGRTTGVKSARRALAFRAAKSRTAAVNSSSALARWIQPWKGARSASGLARTMSNLGAADEFCSVDQP